ncbi:MAG: GlcG/HbpS family heme-binding protein [Janthinobacterium lividum]
MSEALVRPALKLTHRAALDLVQHAAHAAEVLGVPQVIAVVDEGCNLLAFLRMDGARVLSVDSAQRKAMTAATIGKNTGGMDPDLAARLAAATDGRMTDLKGGVPIIVAGQVIGGIGIGSGTGEQDLSIAEAALAAMGLS